MDDLDEFGRELDDPIAELEQDIVHMLFEAYGSNLDAPNRSIGLDDALSGVSDPSLRHRIEQKLTDDPRIDAAEATLTTVNASTVRIDLRIQVDGTELNIPLLVDSAGNLKRAS